jgi:hypothetical protein
MPPRAKLATAPQFLRAPVARGLAAGDQSVEAKGGDNKAGIIRGMAIATVGEALGHDMWLDAQCISQVVDLVNASDKGMKARFTHPGLSSDGLGKYLGRVKNASIDGDVARGDLHLSDLSREAPDGDLGGYVMQLAVDDPEAFGNSIVFEHDRQAEQQLLLDNGAEYETDDEGRRYLSLLSFTSPDPKNVENYPHCRLKTLRAVDVVDDPAANPNGLFHRGDQASADAEALMAFSLGLTSERPQLSEFDIDPDRFAGFVKTFLGRHKLAVTPLEPIMPDPTNPPPATPPASEPPPVVTDPAKPPEEKKPDEKPPEKPVETETQAGAKTGADFLSAFGDQGGVWFAQGKTFDQATQLHLAAQTTKNAELAAENEKLRKQLAAHTGETTALSGNRPAEEASPELEKLEKKLGSKGLARFALANKIHRN